jgi:predicted HicB family RNase H-like nuclease
MAGVHTELMRVRVNPALRARAAARAQTEGMSLSELVRAAIRRELNS